MNEESRYEDIIHLPHHRSKTRPHMSNYDRAAQFSPFAALKGYDDEIGEAARFTEERTELDESGISAINDALLELKACGQKHPMVAVTFFKADARKAGGAVLTVEGELKKLDEERKRLVMADGETIGFDSLIGIRIL